MIEETKIQKAFAWILFMCGAGLGYLAIGESLIHIVCDVIGFSVHPTPNTGRMRELVAVITVIAGAQGGAKWLSYKHEKDCMLCKKNKKQGE